MLIDTPCELPRDTENNIDTLSGIFNRTTGTYKFYWFLSILDLVCLRKMTQFTDRQIIPLMIAKAWYPRVYFRLSFGFQEKLSAIIDELHQIDQGNKIGKNPQIISDFLFDSNHLTQEMYRKLTRYVPTCFLSPWFSSATDTQIIELSQTFNKQCLYAIYKDGKGWRYEINPKWVAYLNRHYQELKGFAYWHLLQFLQKRNLNVPNIVSKLIATDKRPSMSNQRYFWKSVMALKGDVKSLYTGAPLYETSDWDLDHFMPWSFVTHNQLWNLIPVEESINSSKNDRLPDLSLVPKMAAIQYDAIHTFINHGGKEKALEDFCDLGIDTRTLLALSNTEFENLYTDTYAPMRQLALNMGFETWQPDLPGI